MVVLLLLVLVPSVEPTLYLSRLNGLRDKSWESRTSEYRGI